MPNPNIECEHCGGTDFYKEAGFFFCKGCQVQSQEVQEYVFEDDFTAEVRAKSTKVHSDKPEKVDNKITSWECYNYILLGLTEELIRLGAHKDLKTVVRILWLRYLEKLQVFQLGQDRLPKLQAVCSGMDGEIVYGKLAKMKRKRRKSSSSEVDATTLDSSSMKQERIKRKRALMKAQYEEYSQKSQGTPSLHNETLASLQTGSEKSSKNTIPISYNIYAARELRKFKKSKHHWRKHRVDFEHNLKCHKFSYRKISHKYRESPFILSLNKVYSILYLSLLILKEKIQLSDILRFIKEGHLSFNCYSHFFPDDFSDKVLNFRNFKKNSVFANGPFRVIASEMSVFLQVDYYVSCPDLVELCTRYCRELNLPHQICECAKNIMSRTEINLSFRKRVNKVPNYESRTLSIILFVVKLLFGLDGITEFHLGNYSDVLNRTKTKPKFFNVIQWLKYIEYRDLAMVNEYFPSSFANHTDVKNVGLALGALARKEYPTETKLDGKKDKCKQVLEKLKKEMEQPESIEFPPTLTPYSDYVKLLPKQKYLKILSKDFSTDSLVHILQPTQFLENLKNLEVVHGGANEDWILEKITRPEQDRHDFKKRRKFVTVKLSFDHKRKTETPEVTEDNGESLRESFQETNESKFRENVRLLGRKNLSSVEFDFDRIEVSGEDYPRHYNPYERFWMRTKPRLEALSHKEFKKFVEKFPDNFLLLLKECQRIAQQSQQEFLVEYQLTELHLVYSANYGAKKGSLGVVKDRLIANYLTKCAALW